MLLEVVPLVLPDRCTGGATGARPFRVPDAAPRATAECVPECGPALPHGPKPGGAFSSVGVLRTFQKHQKVPPHTSTSEKIIVNQPPGVILVSEGEWWRLSAT